MHKERYSRYKVAIGSKYACRFGMDDDFIPGVSLFGFCAFGPKSQGPHVHKARQAILKGRQPSEDRLVHLKDAVVPPNRTSPFCMHLTQVSLV